MTWRQRCSAAAVIVLSVLVFTAVPAQAGTLSFEDGFEDEPADQGIPEAWSGYNNPDASQINVTTVRAYNSTQSVGFSNTSFEGIQKQISSDGTLNNITFAMRSEGGNAIRIEGRNASGVGRTWSIQLEDDLYFIESSGQRQLISSTPNASDWVLVTVYNISASGDYYSVEWEIPAENKSGSANIGASNPDVVIDPWRDLVVLGTKNTFADSVSVEAPGQLQIRKEEQPSQLIDDRQVNLTFYYTNGTVRAFAVNDGDFNLSKISDSEDPIVVQAETSGYTNRRVFIRSFLETNSIYLLNTSRNFVQPLLEFRDFSGDFQTAGLIIQREINGNWETIEGDFVDAGDEYASQLRFNVRHRIIVFNPDTNTERILGPFVPTGSGTKVIAVEQTGEIAFTNLPYTTVYAPSARSVPARNVTFTVQLDNRTVSLSSYNLSAIHNSTSGNTTLNYTTGSNATGETLRLRVNLTGLAPGRLILRLNGTDGTGGFSQEFVVYQISEYFASQFSLINIIGDIPGRFPVTTAASVTTAIAIMMTIVGLGVVGRLGLSTEQIGLVGVVILTGWALVGWISYAIVFAAGVAWGTTTAIRRGL